MNEVGYRRVSSRQALHDEGLRDELNGGVGLLKDIKLLRADETNCGERRRNLKKASRREIPFLRKGEEWKKKDGGTWPFRGAGKKTKAPRGGGGC